MKIIFLFLFLVLFAIILWSDREDMTSTEKTLEITKVGQVDINGSLHTTGRVDIDKELNIGGAIILPQSPLNVPNELNVSNNITANRDIDVKGNLTVLGKTNISGNLNVGGMIGSTGGFKTAIISSKDSAGFTNGWGPNVKQTTCYTSATIDANTPWNIMRCPPGKYVSGIKTTHKCGQNEVHQSDFAVECSKLDTI